MKSDEVEGISISESISTEKNRMKFDAGDTKEMSFVMTQNAPILFKCSDNASIEFVEKRKKVKLD